MINQIVQFRIANNLDDEIMKEWNFKYEFCKLRDDEEVKVYTIDKLYKESQSFNNYRKIDMKMNFE